MDNSPYDNEGFSALDIPTTAALQYVRETAALAARRAAASRAVATVSPEAARTLLVVDAGCDLPSAWLASWAKAAPRSVRAKDWTSRMKWKRTPWLRT